MEFLFSEWFVSPNEIEFSSSNFWQIFFAGYEFQQFLLSWVQIRLKVFICDDFDDGYVGLNIAQLGFFTLDIFCANDA